MFNGLDERIGIMLLAGHHIVRPDPLDQGPGLSYLTALARARHEAKRIARSIRRMNLRAQATSRFTPSLLLGVSFLQPVPMDAHDALPARHQLHGAYTRYQWPDSCCRFRHGEPVRAIHGTAPRNFLTPSD